MCLLRTGLRFLTVEPFAVLFRISAGRAEVARFTPDSRQVVFVSGGTRLDPPQISLYKTAAHVERWSIADQKLVASDPLPRLICGSEELSPGGTILVCDTGFQPAAGFLAGAGRPVFSPITPGRSPAAG